MVLGGSGRGTFAWGALWLLAACGKDASTTSSPSTSCTDGKQNGDETNVDCGGSCTPCNGGDGGSSSSGGAGGKSGASGAGAGTSGGSGGASGAGAASDAGDASPPDSGAGAPALSVTAIDTFATDNGLVKKPADLSQFDIGVLTYDAAGNGFSAHSSEITGAGTFEVKSLPPGERYVRYARLGDSPSYFVTTSNTLDLGSARVGRPDVKPITAGTKITLNVSGLDAWQADDSLDLYSLGAATYGTDLETAFVTGAPAANDVALSSATLDDTSGILTTLIDGPSGDRAYLTHLSSKSLSATESYLSLTRAFSFPSFTLTAGQTTTLSGAFTAPSAKSIDVDWKGSAFGSTAIAENPGATVAGAVFGGYFQEFPELGVDGSSPDAFRYFSAASGDLAATFSYADPFPASWALMMGGQVLLQRSYSVPGATPVAVLMHMGTRIQPSGPATLSPLVGDVRNLKVGGKSAVTDAAAVGVNPTVVFDAPTTGTPNGYEVQFIRLANAGGATTRTLTARLRTAGTSFVVPPGIFTVGQSYAMSVFALVNGNVDMNTRPLGGAYPSGTSVVMSGVVTP